MKGIVAICFFLLAAAASVSGKPGGYTAANDVIKVKFDESKWGEAKRAGALARSLQLGNDASDLAQVARESKASQLDDLEPVTTTAPEPVTIAPEPAAEPAPAPVVQPSVVPAAFRQPYFNQFFVNPYFSFPRQQLFYRF